MLRQRPYDAAQIRALLGITPTAASRLRTLDQFLEQVAYQGRRLARAESSAPGEVGEILGEFDALLDRALAGGFAPSREQLQLVTRLALESGLLPGSRSRVPGVLRADHAETQATAWRICWSAWWRVLTRTFHARSGRLQLLTLRPPENWPARSTYGMAAVTRNS